MSKHGITSPNGFRDSLHGVHMLVQPLASEKIIGSACGNNEFIERNALVLSDNHPIRHVYFSNLSIMIACAAHTAATQLTTNRKCYISRFKTARRHLIEQRGEAMVVPAVDYDHIIFTTVDTFCKGKPSESGSHNDETLFFIHKA